MNRRTFLAAAATLAPATTLAPSVALAKSEATSADLPAHAETEHYIRKAAEEWASVGVTGDYSPLRRILADDYVGVTAAGEIRSKAHKLRIKSGPPPFSASRVEYVNFRHYGNMVIAQGAETHWWRDTSRPPVRQIWTDIWMFRNGMWQMVTSHDSLLPPTKQAPFS